MREKRAIIARHFGETWGYLGREIVELEGEPRATPVNQPQIAAAASAPASCAKTNHGASSGLIPANVSDKDRAIVIAGFANEVDAVHQ